jgi:hypothetical protein
LTLARQALYHLNHALSPFFALVIFQVGSLIFAQGWPQTAVLPPVVSDLAEISCAFCYTLLNDLDMVMLTFCPI